MAVIFRAASEDAADNADACAVWRKSMCSGTLADKARPFLIFIISANSPPAREPIIRSAAKGNDAVATVRSVLRKIELADTEEDLAIRRDPVAMIEVIFRSDQIVIFMDICQLMKAKKTGFRFRTQLGGQIVICETTYSIQVVIPVVRLEVGSETAYME